MITLQYLRSPFSIQSYSFFLGFFGCVHFLRFFRRLPLVGLEQAVELFEPLVA